MTTTTAKPRPLVSEAAVIEMLGVKDYRVIRRLTAARKMPEPTIVGSQYRYPAITLDLISAGALPLRESNADPLRFAANAALVRG